MINIKQSNLKKIEEIFIFCNLYKLHRDFLLSKNIAKHDILKWTEAEKISNFCNMLIKTKVSTAKDFIKSEDENANIAIENYNKLKDYLLAIKKNHSVKTRDRIYKAVKIFYKKKYFCYQMDSYFINLSFGVHLLINKQIGELYFEKYYWNEISLFTGKTSPLKLKNVIKIYSKINSLLFLN